MTTGWVTWEWVGYEIHYLTIHYIYSLTYDLSSPLLTVTIVGQVKRHLTSSHLLHVKVTKQLLQTSSTSSLVLQHNPVLRVQLQTKEEHIKRNKPYIMVLQSREKNSYHLLTRLEYSKELVTIIEQHCSLWLVYDIYIYYNLLYYLMSVTESHWLYSIFNLELLQLSLTIQLPLSSYYCTRIHAGRWFR